MLSLSKHDSTDNLKITILQTNIKLKQLKAFKNNNIKKNKQKLWKKSLHYLFFPLFLKPT
jgi:hypothetical protein